MLDVRMEIYASVFGNTFKEFLDDLYKFISFQIFSAVVTPSQRSNKLSKFPDSNTHSFKIAFPTSEVPLILTIDSHTS